MNDRALFALLAVSLSTAACGLEDPPAFDEASSTSTGSGEGGEAATVSGANGATTASSGGGTTTSSGAGGASSGGTGGSGGEGGTLCVGETDAELCSAASAECGSIDVMDSCGVSRTPACGGCTGNDTCGGAGVDNTCGCTNESDSAFCAANSWACGEQTGTDNCGDARTTQCGSCSGYTSCDSGGSCSCDEPPEPTIPGCVNNGGPKVLISSPTGWVAYTYAASGGTPAACGVASTHHMIVGNGISLSAPFLNQCGTYRFCTWNAGDICDEDYSEDKLLQICVDSVGSPTCSVL